MLPSPTGNAAAGAALVTLMVVDLPVLSIVTRPLTPQDVAEAIVWVMRQPAHVNVPQLVVLPQDHPI